MQQRDAIVHPSFWRELLGKSVVGDGGRRHCQAVGVDGSGIVCDHVVVNLPMSIRMCNAQFILMNLPYI